MKSFRAVLVAFSLLAGGALAQSGAVLYQQNCAFCHGEKGLGRTGAFPPLVEHAPTLVQNNEGRSYVAQLLLYGLQGELVVKGQRYNGVMAPFSHLKDEELAAILNYVLTAWGNDKLLPQGFKPFTAADFTPLRSTRLTPAQVMAQRIRLGLR
ncbi:MAG: cytochrome C biogenesis protein CcsB [Meiothermus sp.]